MANCLNRFGFLALMSFVAYASGCERARPTSPTSRPVVSTSRPIDKIDSSANNRDRTSLVFDQALYLKPHLEGDAVLHQRLAPLIAIGVSGAIEDLWRILPLDLDVDYTKSPPQAQSKPRLALYWAQDKDASVEPPRDRMTYLWYKWDDRLHTPTGGTSIDLRHIAISITLDKSGSPMIVRVHEGNSGAGSVRFFVTQAVETAARTEFGAPLAGRNFSVEPAMDLSPVTRDPDSPGPVVPRLLAQGPEPSGPWVYVDASDGRVTTILCRCSPSQVKAFVDTREYELRPLPELPGYLTQPSSAGLRIPKSLP